MHQETEKFQKLTADSKETNRLLPRTQESSEKRINLEVKKKRKGNQKRVADLHKRSTQKLHEINPWLFLHFSSWARGKRNWKVSGYEITGGDRRDSIGRRWNTGENCWVIVALVSCNYPFLNYFLGGGTIFRSTSFFLRPGAHRADGPDGATWTAVPKVPDQVN